jgi:hypothetical protein
MHKRLIQTSLLSLTLAAFPALRAQTDAADLLTRGVEV